MATKSNPKTSKAASGRQKNEGEGNRTAAREYNKATTAFAHSGKVAPAAKRAKESLEGPEGAQLRKAELTGLRKVKGGATVNRER